MKLLAVALAVVSLVALVAAGLAGLGDDSAKAGPTEATATAPEGVGTPAPSIVAESAEPGPAAAPVEGTDAAPELRALPPADGVPEATAGGPLPVGLRIPDLDIVDSPIRPVGVEPTGEFEVPIASEVGWYRFGSGPGRDGSTVMAAHIAYDGEDGVFRYLSTVEPGATVEVELDDGSTVAYEVVERATYLKTELPFPEIFSESGPDRLVLITCGGDFNPDLQSYESNVVAYAEPVR